MTSSTDSSSKPKKPRYIYDLPYPERKKLCQILDTDGKWEELGGRFMNLSSIDLSAFGRAFLHRGSPTSDLLDRFGRENGTIDRFFVMLHKMNHLWAMTAIKEYVSPKYLHFLNRSSAESSEIMSKCTGDNFQPSAPSQSQIGWGKSSSWGKSSGSEPLGATGYAFSKMSIDPDNLNHNNSQSSLHPQKMNGLYPDTNRTRKTKPGWDSERNMTASQSLNESNNSRNLYCGKRNIAQASRHSPVPPVISPNRRPSINDSKSPSLELNIPVADKELNKIPEAKSQASAMKISEDLPSFMRIPYAELVHGTNNFRKENILGSGGFGIVYKAVWKGNSVAVKLISPKNKTDPECASRISFKQSKTEMNVLYRCRFDYILPLYGISMDGPHPCLIYQFMVNGSLEDRLTLKGGSKPLNWDQRSKIALGTAKGLHYLHTVSDKPLIHGDIKSANILLDKDMEPKIGDFGLARQGPPGDKTHVNVSTVHGTKVYLPAEYLRNAQLSEKVDVYSYGVVLLEIATGLRPFNDKLQRHIVELVSDKGEDFESLRDTKAGEQKKQWFEKLVILGRKCSAFRKGDRPLIKEVVDKLNESQRDIEEHEKICELGVILRNRPPLSPLELPPLSPMEIQILYDLQKGINFMSRMPTGVQGPPPFLAQDISLPSMVPSVHTSEIRAPPSLKQDYFMKYGPPGVVPVSSVAATDGSSHCPQVSTTNMYNNHSEKFSPSATSKQSLSEYSESLLPNLTVLGIKHEAEESILCGIPSRDHVVVTERVEESDMKLGISEMDLDNTGYDSDEEEEEEEDEGNDSSGDNERVFQMTDIKTAC